MLEDGTKKREGYPHKILPINIPLQHEFALFIYQSLNFYFKLKYLFSLRLILYFGGVGLDDFSLDGGDTNKKLHFKGELYQYTG